MAVWSEATKLTKHKFPQVGLRAEESARFAPTFGMTMVFGLATKVVTGRFSTDPPSSKRVVDRG